MNQSIQSVMLNTTDEDVREVTRQLYALANRRVRVTFVKKNGKLRVMDCVPRNQFNAVMGIKSTAIGCEIVASKARNDMIVVAEIMGDRLQPRTINLRTVQSIVPLAA